MMSDSPSIDDVLPAVYTGLRASIDRALHRYRIPAEDAEDLVQTVLLAAVSKWSTIHDLDAWLLGSLHKCCMRYWRDRMQHNSRFHPLDARIEPAASPAQGRWELLVDLDAASRRLPATQRRLVTLRCRLGLTTAEAEDALGLAHGSGRKILGRALVRLRQNLDAPPQPQRSRRA